jgi:hypothetical protein
VEHRYLFVCGLHRSGTSLLFRCLRQHPLVSGFSGTGVPEDEGQHLQTVYPPAYALGGPGRFGFDPASHLTEDSALVSAANRAKLLAEWGAHWDLGRPILLEKSPPNLVRSRFLQALLPESTFLVITRHPIANAYATQKWSRTPLWSLVHHWLLCHERFEADRPRLSQVISLKYEDLVASPDATLARVYAALEVEPVPAGLEIRPEINRAYFERWERRQRSLLSRPYLAALRRRFEGRVRRFGYSLDRLEPLAGH